MNHLDLLSRAGAELSVMMEWQFGYPDCPRAALDANPEAAAVILEIHKLLAEQNFATPEPIQHFYECISADGRA